MIVSEFIEWLKTQDQTATVEVLCEDGYYGYDEYGEECCHTSFYPKTFTGYSDTYDYNPKTKTLLLGAK